ncbi:MAG: hypothetical protein ACPGVB_09265 [Chitinophagales bacterium]
MTCINGGFEISSSLIRVVAHKMIGFSKNVESAATATELVTQLCVLATKNKVRMQETMGLLEVVKEWMTG